MCHISDLFFELIYVRNSWKLAAVTGWITELLPLISVYTKNCSVIQSLNDTDSINSTLPSVKMRGVHCRKLSFCIISSLDLFFLRISMYRKLFVSTSFDYFSLAKGSNDRFIRLLFSHDFFVLVLLFILFLFLFLFLFSLYACWKLRRSFANNQFRGAYPANAKTYNKQIYWMNSKWIKRVFGNKLFAMRICMCLYVVRIWFPSTS